jgi:hypothetical protein
MHGISQGALRLYERAKRRWCIERLELATKLAGGKTPKAKHWALAQAALAADYDRDVRKFLADPRYSEPVFDRFAALPVVSESVNHDC